MATLLPRLPQLGGGPFLADAGLETVLAFQQGIDLPHFAAFPLLRSEHGRSRLLAYYRSFVDLAAGHDTGLVLEAPTWRAGLDWGRRLGYPAADLAALNREAMHLLAPLRALLPPGRLVASGCIGPRGDGYVAGGGQDPLDARDHHQHQADALADGGADMLSAMTMTHAGEAIGITLAARRSALPVAVSFTVETDGRLPDGTRLADAIDAVDQATDGYAAYFMVNCAHPSHFRDELLAATQVRERVRGIRANASRLSHAELDACTALDDGDPEALGQDYRTLREALPGLTVLGGCCGTDLRHIAAIARACLPAS